MAKFCFVFLSLFLPQLISLFNSSSLLSFQCFSVSVLIPLSDHRSLSLSVLWLPSPSSLVKSHPFFSSPLWTLPHLPLPPPPLSPTLSSLHYLSLWLDHSLLFLSFLLQTLTSSLPLQIKILSLSLFHYLFCLPFISSVSLSHPRRHCFSSPFITMETEETTSSWQHGNSLGFGPRLPFSCL